jgi:hypothetical protein
VLGGGFHLHPSPLPRGEVPKQPSNACAYPRLVWFVRGGCRRNTLERLYQNLVRPFADEA